MDQALQVFLTVVEKQNFSKAAKELHMTQPAVSQYIQALERTMGTKLLERTNKFVRLNKAGEIVYHHGKEILNSYSKMQFLIDDLTNNPSGPLTIGASYTYGEYVLPPIIAKLQQKYPAIQPTISIANTKEIAQLVLAHDLDIGILEGEYHDKNLIITPFATDQMSMIASPNSALIGKQPCAAQLESETWIVREHGSGTREATEKLFEKLGISPKKVLEFGSTQLIKESVEAGIGISLLSNWAIRKEIHHKTLHQIAFPEMIIERNFSTALSSPFQTKALAVFIELLIENN